MDTKKYIELLDKIVSNKNNTTENVNTKYSKIFSDSLFEKENSNINSRILIVDGMNTYIRAFIKSPMLNVNGIHVGGLCGFLMSIGQAIKLFNATKCIIVFDGEGGSLRRRKLYPDYKNKSKTKINFNRAYDFSSESEELQSMARQLARLSDYLQCLPVITSCIDKIEADDTIAYIANQIFSKDENKVCIMSADKDFLQLVNNRICVWSPTKKKLYKQKEIFEEYGIQSDNFVLYRMLDGDVSDNIPGIKGIGLKTIKKYLPVLTENKKIDMYELKEYCESIDKKKKVHQNIINDFDQLKMNFQLMQLEDVGISESSKERIRDSISGNVPIMNKPELIKLIKTDGISINIFNLSSWSDNTFRYLNSFAIQNNI